MTLGWLRITGQNAAHQTVVHVVPKGDTYEHKLHSDCWCQPDLDEDFYVVTHHSHDQRELYEEGLRGLM
jgi:hypothetical protein